MATNGVYWLGTDGNFWVKGPDGVFNAGAGAYPSATQTKQFGLINASLIDDPNKPTSGGGGSTTISGGGGTLAPTGGTTAPVGPSQAQVDPLLASLGSLDDILGNKNQQSQAEYNRALQAYKEQEALDRKAYDDNVFQNENTLTSNNQRALLNAANGATGLRGVLSSLGGLAGSGVDVIKRLVGLAANEDTGAARQTFDVNASSLNQSWGQAEREQRQRREDAEANLQNTLQNNKAGVLTSRQSILQQLAGLYGDELPEGRQYASQAAALAAPIAETTRATVAPYAKASSLFSPGQLEDYLAGTKNLSVDTSGGGSRTPINSPVYSANRKKDQLAGVA